MVTFTVTTTIMDKIVLEQTFQNEFRSKAIDEWVKDEKHPAFFLGGSKHDIRPLLISHDDLRIGGPTWDMRFQFTFHGAVKRLTPVR